MNKELKDKACKASKRYLDLMGYEILGEVDGFIVCREVHYELCFVSAIVRINDEISDFPESELPILKLKFERAQVKWFEEHDDEHDLHLRCDELQMLIINSGRVIIRHAINVF